MNLSVRHERNLPEMRREAVQDQAQNVDASFSIKQEIPLQKLFARFRQAFPKTEGIEGMRAIDA